MKKYIYTIVLIAAFLTSFTHATEDITEILSLRDLTLYSDLIVVGEIQGIESAGPFFGYDSEGKIKDPAGRDPDLGLPAINYSIAVEDVIHDQLNLYKGGNLILRLMGETDDPNFEKVYNSMLGKTIFFLSQNPDQNSYGFRNYQSMIHVDKEMPYFQDFDGDGRFYIFEEGSLLEVETTEFLDKVVDSINRE